MIDTDGSSEFAMFLDTDVLLRNASFYFGGGAPNLRINQARNGEVGKKGLMRKVRS
jgi:hypothetical protein